MSEKQRCPGCGKDFARLASHVKFCKANLQKPIAPQLPKKLPKFEDVEPVVEKPKKMSFLDKLRERLRNRSHKLK